MALSDEDYGILLNAIDTGHIDLDCAKILYTHCSMGEWIQGAYSRIYLLDFAAFIVLAEGRELP